MQYYFILIYILLIPIIGLLWNILNVLQKQKQTPVKEEPKQPRRHLSIGQSDFENAFGGRKAYSIYKNTNGLYEPVTPSKGISIKNKKKEEE